MRRLIRRKITTWLDRRIPPAASVTLNQKRIFIFPSRYGALYLAMSIGVLMAAINYEKNMLFALAFWLLSLYAVAILHTYMNLAGLTIATRNAHPAFAGAPAEFDLDLSTRRRRRHEDLRLGWPGEDLMPTQVAPEQPTQVTLTYQRQRRGWLRPGRLLVESFYPLGLLRAWTWIDLDVQTLIYPAPVATDRLPPTLAPSAEGHDHLQGQSDEFNGFRDYQPGDSLRHVLGKTLAKGQPLQTRLYQDL